MRWPKSFLELQSCLEIHIKIQVAETKPGVLFPVVRKSQVFSHRRAVQARDEGRVVWRWARGPFCSVVGYSAEGWISWQRQHDQSCLHFEQGGGVKPKNEGENDLGMAAIDAIFSSFCSSWKIIQEKLSHRRNREPLCSFFFFQINLPAELKIQSTSALRYLTITQKRCFCAERGLSFHWNKLFFFFNCMHVTGCKWTSESRRLK